MSSAGASEQTNVYNCFFLLLVSFSSEKQNGAVKCGAMSDVSDKN